ncbi:SurA N-terminal domain-containing protein [Phytoactinopolyspora mesophila]|uniref:SurA N-terminal domain-containing protein n=1 Tax=Phytoactinopolyspora mesophila TaxID=2650750 RepID=UPI001391241E
MSVYQRILAVSAAAAAVAMLTACDPDQIGTAATVGDDRLSVSELQDQVTEIVEFRNDAIETLELPMPPVDPGRDVSGLQRDVLNSWVIHRLGERAARDLGIHISEAEIDDFLEQYATQLPDGDLTPLLVEEGWTEDMLRDEVRLGLINQQVAATEGPEALSVALGEAAQEAGVDINPRYGTWADAEGLVAASGSVSHPFEDDPLADIGHSH